ncbi:MULTISPECIES: AraC family transcriptional regulator [unclassified Paenibacillus]|uniref:AraC family transcriptional regulator n=1 Tax=unclassified Paenibacillus TaxID=185978 RepID=UPI000837B45B|nr:MULTISPECIES: AraC family transcriptional regulator [unclassified Paenibacillus]NWL88202.1 AraC family transcriptional regulator [Paenibacillus sp. 79R4]
MYPEYLFEYPNMNASFPFYMKRKLQWKTPSHRHDFVELTLVLNGQGTETINGAMHDMIPGIMVLLLPYQVHEIVSHPNDPLDLYICNFPLDVILELGELDPSLHEVLLGNATDARNTFVHFEGRLLDEMQQIFTMIWNEYGKPVPFATVMLKANLQRVLTQFARSSLQAITDISTSVSSQISPSQVRSVWPIIRYIHEHYLEPLNLTDLSERFGFHPSSLSELFARQYGIHFIDLLHELRVRHACSLLHATEMQIADIAEESGFGSYSSFARIFRKTKGVSPKAYRISHHRTGRRKK